MESLKNNTIEHGQYQEIANAQISELFKIASKLAEPNAQYGQIYTAHLDKKMIEGTVFEEMAVDLVMVDYWQKFGHTEKPSSENNLVKPTKVKRTRMLISEFKIIYNADGLEDDVLARYFLIVDNKRKTKNRKRYGIQTQYAKTTENGIIKEDSFDEYLTQREADDLLRLLKQSR